MRLTAIIKLQLTTHSNVTDRKDLPWLQMKAEEI